MKHLHQLIIVAMLASVVLVGNGCMSMANIAEQLKTDPATIDINVTTPWGSSQFHRAFPTNWTQPITVVMPSTVTTNK